MQDVINWLNSQRQDYATGVALYVRYGSDSALKTAFTKEAESAFKKNKLLQVLQQLVAVNKQRGTAPAVVAAKQSPRESFKYWPPLPISDKIVAALYAQWRPMFVNMQALQARIYDVALLGRSDQNKRLEACQMAHQILDLDDKCESIYKKRDFYYESGHLPGDSQDDLGDVVGDPVRWATCLQNAERYVREFRIKVKNNPENEKLAARLKKHEETVKYYRKLLKLDL